MPRQPAGSVAGSASCPQYGQEDSEGVLMVRRLHGGGYTYECSGDGAGSGSAVRDGVAAEFCRCRMRQLSATPEIHASPTAARVAAVDQK